MVLPCCETNPESLIPNTAFLASVEPQIAFDKFGFFNGGIGKKILLTENAERTVVECGAAGECGGCGPDIQTSSQWGHAGVLKLELRGEWEGS